MRDWFEHLGRYYVRTDWTGAAEYERSGAFVEVSTHEVGIAEISALDVRYFRERLSDETEPQRDYAIFGAPLVEVSNYEPEPVRLERDRNAWVQIELVDDEGKPISNELCRLTLPDGKVFEAMTDVYGAVRVSNIDQGQCTVQFPRLGDAWTPA